MQENLFLVLKPLLQFGRCIGFVPLRGLFGQCNGSKKIARLGERSMCGSVMALVIISSLAVFAVLLVIASLLNIGYDTVSISESISGIVYPLIGFFVCVYMYKNCETLLEVCYQWRHLTLTFYQPDTTLVICVNIIAGFIMVSGILENVSSHWKVLVAPKNDPVLPWTYSSNATITHSSASYAEIYWWIHDYRKFSPLLNYHPLWSLYFFICDKWCVYAWNFGDAFLSCLARALYMRFYLHYKCSSQTWDLICGDLKRSSAFWDELVTDHEKLTSLLESFNRLMSPLIFCCSATNVYFVGRTLFFVITTSSSGLVLENNDFSDYVFLHQLYIAWAFLHLFCRTFLTFLCLAKVNEYAHLITRLLQKCPVHCWTKRVEMLELRLRTSTVGLTGLGYFTVTKPFILGVINVIFTFEIVLLQAIQSK